MNVKVFTFQKDEDDILSDWLAYHSYLFGKKNVYVIDHNSKKSCEIISSSGVNLIKYNGPFEQGKGRELTRVINKYKTGSDFVIPLDCDEFIVFNDRNFSTSKDLINNHLASIFSNKYIEYKFVSRTVMKSNVQDILTQFSRTVLEAPKSQHRWKSFYASKNFQQTDQGNHGRGRNYLISDLAILHFHNRGFDHFKRKYMRWPNCYTEKSVCGGHWKQIYNQIKNMNDKELYDFWIRDSSQKADDLNYSSFKNKIQELRNK